MYENLPIIISCDHGYGNIKGTHVIFPTGIEEITSRPVFPTDILQWNGRMYALNGHKEFMEDKTRDEDFRLLTMAVIAKELQRIGKTEAIIYLAAGLPLTWASDQYERFRGYLLSPREYDFTFNDTKYSVRIEDVFLYPQGFAALADHLNDYVGMNMIADIGNGTMSVIAIHNGEPVPSACYTETLGVQQCAIALRNTVLQRFHYRLPDHMIDAYLRTGNTEATPEMLAVMRRAAEQYVNSTFRSLREHDYNPALMKLHFMGGGSVLVRAFGDRQVCADIAAGRILINDDLHATANGYERLAREELAEKGIRTA